MCSCVCVSIVCSHHKIPRPAFFLLNGCCCPSNTILLLTCFHLDIDATLRRLCAHIYIYTSICCGGEIDHIRFVCIYLLFCYNCEYNMSVPASLWNFYVRLSRHLIVSIVDCLIRHTTQLLYMLRKNSEVVKRRLWLLFDASWCVINFICIDKTIRKHLFIYLNSMPICFDSV